MDEDQRHEEEALMGRHVNPSDIDYGCLCWSHVDPAPDSVSAADVGWPDSMSPRHLSKSDFTCKMPDIVRKLTDAVGALYTQFQKDLQADGAEEKLVKEVNTLDPTQLEAYKYIAEWSEQRLQWRQALPTPPTATPPRSTLLLAWRR